MQSGKKYGMQTLNDALYQLYTARDCSVEECLRVSPDPTEFLRMTGEVMPGEEPGAGGKPQRPGAMAGRR
jgi:twitching motility protein PilT